MIIAYDRFEQVVTRCLKDSAIPYASLADLSVRERQELLRIIETELALGLSDPAKESVLYASDLDLEQLEQCYEFGDQL